MGLQLHQVWNQTLALMTFTPQPSGRSRQSSFGIAVDPQLPGGIQSLATQRSVQHAVASDVHSTIRSRRRPGQAPPPLEQDRTRSCSLCRESFRRQDPSPAVPQSCIRNLVKSRLQRLVVVRGARTTQPAMTDIKNQVTRTVSLFRHDDGVSCRSLASTTSLFRYDGASCRSPASTTSSSGTVTGPRVAVLRPPMKAKAGPSPSRDFGVRNLTQTVDFLLW